ncbi:BTAD domain-containing putative transcriptional regulator [Lentzea sp. BCCO 10_0856]|uniref:BTAD domain-containing putative transcriptional regulator n=1 Tax=Lentzea miocenica TaxID=3095431 RepID=A0ABU4T075_9PSEU|nr:BTAD domain-containing putative transcriptional regulator [Lentzea sp. BCCO 10_0856]MDX8031543.1 BTAD domain-containing putative transcriptional regulator [Lentzea sp. BCCO 10_0856]
MDQLNVRLLGPLEVTGPGGVLRLAGTRQRSLLALLALRAPSVLPATRLIDALWGTEPPPTALRTLHSHIARVRSALAAIGLTDVLVTTSAGYALRIDPSHVDVTRFERAPSPRAALTLWRGDPLSDCDVFEWASAEITRLHEARLSTEEALAQQDIGRGACGTAAAQLERLVVSHPLRERFWELLADAQLRGGRRADALSTVRRARNVLVEELGVDPGPGLRAVEAAALACPPPDEKAGLVGRQRETQDIMRLLDKARLVTLTGPAGCGKSRLAQHVTPSSTVVDLTSANSVEDAVAAAFAITTRELNSLGNTVLVLDNCERLRAKCAVFVAAHPRLRVLATSREPLNVPGETVYPIPPLAVPDPDVPRSLTELAAYDAVQLFLDRAAHAYTDADAPAIAQLCAALDGLPLALELAAARTSVLTPAQIVRRLRDRFGLLGPLRAAIAWSHDLLTASERSLFADLAVCAGGFPADLVEALASSLDALTGLVAKSLVRVSRVAGETRFSMLETVHAFALEQQSAAHAGVADFFLRLAERAEADSTGTLLNELRVEHANLQRTMDWFTAAGDTDKILRLVVALNRYWHRTGNYHEGRQWLHIALKGSGPLRGKALASAATLAMLECDYAEAVRYARDGLEADPSLAGRLHRLLGSVARERGHYETALHHYQEAARASNPVHAAYARQLAGATSWLAGDFAVAEADLQASLKSLRDLGDQRGATSSLAYLGAVAWYRGDEAEARELLDEALDTFGELEFKEGIAWALNLLGVVEQGTGNVAAARSLLERSLMLHRELGDRWRQASVLEALADVTQNRSLRAQAAAIRTEIGAPVPTVELDMARSG